MTKRLNPGAAGTAFKRCVAAVEARGGAYSPRGVCATAGRAKYGKKRFQEMAAAGKRRAKRGNPWGDYPDLIWAIYKGKILLKVNREEITHVDWFEKKGIPTSGPEFDKIQRGLIRIDKKDQKLWFQNDLAEFVPNSVVRHFKHKFPKFSKFYAENPANLTDRALRYRANVEPPPGPKQCAFCGSKKQIQVGHVNGREEDSSPDNLIWTCRSCNVLAGNRLRKAGIGRLTVQYNPADGAKSVGQWLTAVLSMKGESDAMTVPAAVAMIRATSAAQRSRFASEIWDRRRSRGNPATIEHRGHQIVQSLGRGGGYYVSTMPRRGSNEYGWRYPESAKEWIDRKLKGKRSNRNPAEAATEAYQEFHGHAPEETVEITKRVHFHKHLAGAGKLTALVVKGVDHQIHRINGFKGALLAFNEQKNQLFVEGGDQSINLQDFGISHPHELETLGKVVDIDYHTDKSHLGSEGGKAVYAHRFRTTNQDGQHVTVTVARYPDLIYRVRDEQLEFSGGSYQIKAEGIDR